MVRGRVIDYTRGVGVADVRLDWRATFLGTPIQLGEQRSAVSDAMGNYTVSLPAADRYQLGLPGNLGAGVGGMVIVLAKSYQTDFFVNPGNCVVMSGVIVDAVTRTPVSGAQITWVGQRATSGADGTYRIEPGCGRSYGTGTTSFVVSHPNYTTFQGLGTRAEFLTVGGVFRRDEFLTPLSASP